MPGRGGAIEDGNELFGGDRRGDGVARLLELDRTGDLVLNESDAAFNELLIWQDLDSNGASSDNELTSLAERGDVSIDLNFDTSHREIDNGKILGEKSVVTLTNCETSSIVNVYFMKESIFDVSAGPSGIDALEPEPIFDAFISTPEQPGKL